MVDLENQLVVIDTDLAIDFLRGVEPGSGFVLSAFSEGRGRITAVSVFELRAGADFVRKQAHLEPLFAGVLAFDAMSALLAGEVQLWLDGRGLGIGVKDTMIAGICRRFELPLATRNLRHFERVPGLRLVPV